MLKTVRQREELRVVAEEIVCPTSSAELAKWILVLSQTDRYGLYHATAEGSCSCYEFAKKIFEIENNFCQSSSAEISWRISDPKPWMLTLSSDGKVVCTLI
jgi:dTDP-4-dehydrorhamnose reductase